MISSGTRRQDNETRDRVLGSPECFVFSGLILNEPLATQVPHVLGHRRAGLEWN